MLEIRNLRKVYKQTNGELVALDDVSFIFPESGLVALCGENGCGKTTMLNAISTVDIDYTGEIMLDGINIKSMMQDYRRNCVSYVFQENEFVDYLNISENLRLFSEEESEEEVQNRLDEYSIGEKNNEYGNCLSGGQRQRASLIRGILKNSKILLVDEPTSSLNEEMEKTVFQMLKKVSESKLVIFVSHNKSMVQAYADYIITMDKARVIDICENKVAGVVYTENGADIPSVDYKLALLDTTIVKNILGKCGEFVIKVKECMDADTRNFNKKVDCVWKPAKKMSSKLGRKIVFKGVKRNMGSIIGMSLLVSLFVVLLCWLVSLADYDKPRFIYESLKNNVVGDVVYQDSTVASGYVPFGLTNVNEMRELYDSDIIVAEYNEFPYELDCVLSGIYESTLYGYALCDEKIALVAGALSQNDQCMITDYIADGLIEAAEEYKSYEEIINKGISVEGHSIDISGIIDTDYERYKEKYSIDFINSQEYIDYQQNLVYKYARLYQTEKQFISENDQIIDVDEKLDNFVMFKASKELKNPEDIMVNATYAYIYGTSVGNDIYLESSFEHRVVEVVEDGNEAGVIYVSEQVLDELKSAFYDEIQYIVVDLTSIEEVEYLLNKGRESTSSVSGYINDTIFIIDTLQEGFVFLSIILVAIILSLLVAMAFKILKRDNYLMVMLNMNGYSKMSKNALFTCKFGIIAIIVTIMGYGFTALGTLLMNVGMSKVCDMQIRILQLKPSAIVISVAVGIVAVMIGLIGSNIKSRKNINELVRK